MNAARPIRSIIEQARQKLKAAGLWDAETDLDSLVDRFLERSDPDRARQEFMLAVDERCRRVPLGHITGLVEFDQLPLVVGSGVFIPRPHSAVIPKWLASRSDIPPGGQVLDLCAGTGAIGMAIAKRRPDLRVTCVERESVPFQYLERNANRLLAQGVRVETKQADIADPAGLAQFEGTACLVTANPPYVPSATELLPEWGVHHPHAAIYSGADGLDIARQIIRAARALLAPSGWLVIEHGDSQAEAMRAILRMSGYVAVETIVDPEASDATGSSVITIGQQSNQEDEQNMHANAQNDWMTTRRSRTTEAHSRAIQEGLTSFTVSGRRGKQLTLSDGGVYTEFVSCSYLGLEQHPELMEAARTAMDRLGLHLSSSRGAMRPPHLLQLEERLNRIYQGGSAMVFTSTSNAHLGILPLLGSGALANYPVGPAVHWLIDRTAHASMQVLRGILQQFGPSSRVDSFDEQALEDALKRCAAQNQTPVLLIDGIGSMNSMIPVARLARKLSEAGGHIYVDDAHGISITGTHGAGYAFAAVGHALPHNMILAGSLSKAFGGAGGFAVLADGRDYDAIVRLANPLVFGHSIMLPMLAANVAAADIHLDGRILELQTRLWRNVEALDQMTGNRLMNAGMQSPIRGALFDSEEAGLAAASMFKQRGILLFPVFYPIVREGKAMLRFAISANHHPDEIRQLAQAIHAVGQSGLTWSNA